MKKSSAPLNPVFEHQADATLDQANPVSGTKYEVLSTTKRVRIKAIIVKVTWTVQPTPLEIHLTIDGISHTASFSDPESAKNYYVRFYPYDSQNSYGLDGTPYDHERAFMSEGRSVNVEAEITGGTVSNLSARVKYAKIP